MRIKEFTEIIAEGIKARLEGVEITSVETLKNNGTILHGIMFKRNEDNIAPTLYMEYWFNLFRKYKLSTDMILENVIRSYETLPALELPDMNSWLSDPNLLSKISLRLVNLNANRKLIESRGLVYHPIGTTGLMCLFYVAVENEGTEIGELALTERLMEVYLPKVEGAEALYHEVVSRMSAKDACFDNASKLANKTIQARNFNVPLLPDIEYLYILTNESRNFGATLILLDEVREILAEHFAGRVVTILPSSVHELLILPTCERENIKLLRDMVIEVNELLNQDDVLATDVFHYDTSTGILEKAIESEETEE